MKRINKNKGILFWITGLSGSGKTTIGNSIKNDINKIYGPTIMVSGDNIRKIFKLKGYEHKERLTITNKYLLPEIYKKIQTPKISILGSLDTLVPVKIQSWYHSAGAKTTVIRSGHLPFLDERFNL